MQNKRSLFQILPIVALLTGCASFSNMQTPTATGDTNRVVQVAQTFTNDIFTSETPAITTAVAHLPPETQALATAAYAALQRGIDAAIAKGVSDLSTTDQAKAQSALVALGDVTDKLSAALHSGGDPVLSPAPVSPNLVLPGTPALNGPQPLIAPAVPNVP